MNIITPTADGSNTLYNETIGEHYHSKHGALQESKHVFIDAGLKHAAGCFPEQEISILEIGFGTGLNFLMTAVHAEEHKLAINYTGIEAYPLSVEELVSTQYSQYVQPAIWNGLIENYEQAHSESVQLYPGQHLHIAHTTLQDFETTIGFDLIYFDAFSVQHQPEMWSDEIIGHVCSFLKPEGIFVTYAITGKLKRALKSVGMTIEKLPGAPGKREMLRATKLAPGQDNL
jgi:tRNA U34 5-methylaminomethyl-2-thiouridine-forming methyltransferase MnmC